MLSNETSFRLLYNAQIKQNTGEVWKNAKIAVSTATPVSFDTKPPKFDRPLKYTIETPRPHPASDSFYKTAQVSYSGYDYGLLANQSNEVTGYSAPAPPSIPVYKVREEVNIQVKESLGSFTYKIDMPYTIESDNTSHKVTIGSLKLEGELTYLALPALSQAVYLRVI